MKTILARILIGFVFLANIQSALVFLIWPEKYIGSFQLSGAPGEAMLRGLGVLFLMWNVPYAVALWNPVRFRLALWIAIAMQTIGLVGEILIALSLPEENFAIRASISRFVVFDAAGLLLLCTAAWLSVREDPGAAER